VLLSWESCQLKSPANYNNTPADSNGFKFVKSSVESGLTDISASGIAITNTSNLRVIGLAKMVIADQTQIDSALLKIESQKNIAGNDTISAAHALAITDLSKKSGADFDKAYIGMMSADQQSAVDLYTIAVNSTDNDIHSFAVANLPMIKMHLDSAVAITATLK
jgi:putative membrane protein